MAALNIIDIKVLDNPAPFRSPFRFVIKYECIDRLLEETQWKLIYVGSADDEAYDQLLEDVLVASVNLGTYRFLLEADAPDPSRIPEKDKLGLAAILITCSYVDQEFLRVGYFLKNEYDDESLRRKPPKKTLIERVQRTILSEKPKVTKFPINFHPEIAQRGEQPIPEANEEEQAGSEDT